MSSSSTSNDTTAKHKGRRILENLPTNLAKRTKNEVMVFECSINQRDMIKQICDKILKSVEDTKFLRTKLLEAQYISDPIQDTELLDTSISTCLEDFVAGSIQNYTRLYYLINILQLSDECNSELEKLITKGFCDNNSCNETSSKSPNFLADENSLEHDTIGNVSIDSEDSLRSDISYDTSYEIQEAKPVSETPNFGTDCLKSKPCEKLQDICKNFNENKSFELD